MNRFLPTVILPGFGQLSRPNQCSQPVTCEGPVKLTLTHRVSVSHRRQAMSAADVDEFAGYDFSEFTQEDFAQIDAEIVRNQLPKTIIAYEQPCSPQDSISELKVKPRDSPLELFRSYGTLSVTDLVSLAWCEVQFEYGLLGKRSQPLRQRPDSFKSASGKEIKLDTAVAAKNDIILRKGRAIHKKLEREVKPKEVKITVMNSEERWALRLVNMLACLEGMQLEGMTREIPVFGIEDGEIIVGIIDELVYRPIANEEGNKDVTEPSQTDIGTCFSSSARSKAPSPNLFTVQIIDAKTRKRPSLPLDEDMRPAQLQLMLYHRLLSRLVSTKAPFDFMIFWQLVNVNPEQQLSEEFLEQAGLVAEKGKFQVLNLADLSALWHDRVDQLHIASIDDQLQLVYRLQANQKGLKRRTPPLASAAGVTSPLKQLRLTLKDKDPTSKEEANCVPLITTGKDKIIALDYSALTRQHEHDQIIGTKTFQYDSEFLSAYLTDALAWWRGERRSSGVPVELAHRCNACEYYNDCEWREERAKEFQEQARLRRETSESIIP